MATDPEGSNSVIEGPRIETLRGMTVVGLCRAMSFAESSMGELWRAFRPRVHEVRYRTSDNFISMRIYEDPLVTAPTLGSRFEQWAAVEVNKPREIPAGLRSHEVEGGLYACFTYVGRADTFADSARHIYSEWLPGSAYRLADRAFFEVLGPSYRPDDPDAREDIWIPIRSR